MNKNATALYSWANVARFAKGVQEAVRAVAGLLLTVSDGQHDVDQCYALHRNHPAQRTGLLWDTLAGNVLNSYRMASLRELRSNSWPPVPVNTLVVTRT